MPVEIRELIIQMKVQNGESLHSLEKKSNYLPSNEQLGTNQALYAAILDCTDKYFSQK